MKIVDGVEVTICCAEEISEEEVRAYIKFLREKEQADISNLSIDITSDGQASLAYRTNPVMFERIRRITGYLVGTTDRWNNAKRAEEHDRVKHDVGM